ncbi:flagellar hook protein FlgE [Desulfopila aestuarii]|uniref:Flagellar hook protein FlgE n=1 Tax=Desulfopila aestuarii DSM 18488 TaxID=1121416 RepID=A0A1M7YDL1_9BACT|nr:flagellar hook protein FlgE [Desulfopila aestuarii]SHO50722.1 flagellar hook protein FlgE [Desulfopila aestuarii DSM 18488]
MGISSALFSGVSGLNTNAQAMTVIGNNLANTNTIGFKGSRTIFADLLSASISGSGGESQVGRGVGLSSVDGNFAQGTFESTESSLDLAIEGKGFFMLTQEGDETVYYSRAGSFRFDRDGYLTNPEGYNVLGLPYNPDGTLTPGVPGVIQINNLGMAPGEPTAEVSFTTNLDASVVIPAVPIPFDYTDPDTFDYSTTVEIYDTLGTSHLMTTYYKKTGGPEVVPGDPNVWSVYWTAEDARGTPIGSVGVGPAPAGTLTFDGNGDLVTIPSTITIPGASLDWLNGSTAQDINITFNTTQYNSESSVISKEQDGFGPGALTGVNVDEAGAVIATYANGKNIYLANITLGAFNNPGSLKLAGSNLFLASPESGVARVGLPGEELGNVFTNSLEQSNVDMGLEFVRMITVQRGFQANSKIITTIDELMNELINLKR